MCKIFKHIVIAEFILMEILIIDDEKDIRTSLGKFISRLGYKVTAVESAETAMEALSLKPFDVVISDICLAGASDGITFLHKIIRELQYNTSVIMITGYGTMDHTIDALRYGACDFIPKPINVKYLEKVLAKIAEQRKLNFVGRVAPDIMVNAERKKLYVDFMQASNMTQNFVFSKTVCDIFETVNKYIYDKNLPILIEGETGTGKEVIARYIHFVGHQYKNDPFVPINCGAISPSLFESEFFGYEKGAYTGAASGGAKGKIENARGGVLFLDEIGELPLEMQVKLLRVLEYKTFYRIGGTREVSVDFRLICATNRSLKDCMQAGTFRFDLFYRINVGYIYVPPLRRRREDILPLAEEFVRQTCAESGCKPMILDAHTKTMLLNYAWPGNIRELRNCLKRAILISNGDVIMLQDLLFEGPVAENGNANNSPNEPFSFSDGMSLESVQRNIIEKALIMHNGNKSATARYLGISRRVLQGRLQKLNIDT